MHRITLANERVQCLMTCMYWYDYFCSCTTWSWTLFQIKIQSCGPFQSLKVFFPLHTWGPYSEAILGQPTVRFIRPPKPKCSLALELYLGPEKKRTYWKPGRNLCGSQEVIILMIYFIELRQLFKAWTSFALSEKRERTEEGEEKEVLTPNFYGIEKKGWIKKVCKRNFFSCQGKTQKNWNTFPLEKN